jgi:hypothetical protein
MAWTWSGYVDRGVRRAIENPAAVAFLAVLFAVFAGSDWRELKGTNPVDFAHVAVYLELAGSAMCGYLLARAIRQLRERAISAD